MMGADDNATENLVISAWQAIELVGDARERSDEIEPIDLEAVLAQAEEILFSVISGLARFDRRLTGKPRGEPSLERALRHNSHAQTSRWGRRIATLHAAADGASSFAASKLFRGKLSKCASDGASPVDGRNIASGHHWRSRCDWRAALPNRRETICDGILCSTE